MINDQNDKNMIQMYKYTIKTELNILKETNSQKLKQLKLNYSLINKLPHIPNNFPQVIKKAITDIEKETDTPISQFDFFAEYCDEYEDNSSILSSFKSYFKNSRPSPTRMINILNFINNKLPKKHVFDPNFDKDIQTFLARINPDPNNPLDKDFKYFDTLFQNKKAAFDYLNNIINDSFSSILLLLRNLQIINRTTTQIDSWTDLERWIKADTKIKSVANQKFQLIKHLLQMETKINNYKLFNNHSQINGIPFQINGVNFNIYPITNNEIHMLNAIGINNIQRLKATTFPNFKINNEWKEYYHEINHFIGLLENSNETIETFSSCLNSSYYSEYITRLDKENEFPQFNENEFIFKSTVAILNKMINDYLFHLKPKYYDNCILS